MKLKYQISEISKLEQKVLIDKIHFELVEEHCKIENSKKDTISFKDDNFEIRAKGTGFRKVDKGSFEVKPLNGGSLIVYTYYISVLPEFVITSILIVLGFTQSYYIFLIYLPFLIQLTLRTYTLKDVSKQMIKRLAS